jgi:spore coat protein CotF
MTLNLTQKERMLLQDQKNHEEVCIKKYNDYSSKAQSQELKQLFGSYATQEQEHLNSINQMLSGQIPQVKQQQGQQNQQQGQQNQQQGQQNQQQQGQQNQQQGQQIAQQAQQAQQLAQQVQQQVQQAQQQAQQNQQNQQNQQQGQQNQQQGQQNQQQQSQLKQQSMSQKGSFINSDNDKNLCNDMLMTEKYVSGAYDSAVFEMTDTNVRQVLNHIQKEEQGHGEGIYNYMKNNGMYNAQ